MLFFFGVFFEVLWFLKLVVFMVRFKDLRKWVLLLLFIYYGLGLMYRVL